MRYVFLLGELHKRVNVLVVGDVFGRPGRRVLANHLPRLCEKHRIHLVIANAENAAGGKGCTIKVAHELFDAGVDVLTNGNHLLDKREILELLETDPRVLRPYNFSGSHPGKGVCIVQARNGVSIGIINALGRVHMAQVESPFLKIKEHIEKLRETTNCILFDFHAEATSEKRAMGWYVAGLVSVLYGTHTHVPTADEEILNGFTAYVTDVGMTGPYQSVIGLKKSLGIQRFVGQNRGKFEVAKKGTRLEAFLCSIDAITGQCIGFERIRVSEEFTEEI